jgi:hypothetical protein
VIHETEKPKRNRARARIMRAKLRRVEEAEKVAHSGAAKHAGPILC